MEKDKQIEEQEQQAAIQAANQAIIDSTNLIIQMAMISTM